MRRAALSFVHKHTVPLSFILGAAVAGGILLLAPRIALPESPFTKTYPEVEELAQVKYSFQEYSTYFQKLSEEKGALYGFEVLRRAPIPPGIDLHLLGHTVGDMLYKEKKIDGIKYCTDDFRNACSHSVVIGHLLENGEGSLPEIGEKCKEAPGGKGAYTMCFHGPGHGVLAFTGYDFEKAVEMCKKTRTMEYKGREGVECTGGAMMEMIAGVHDADAWERQKEKYLGSDDPLYPCSASFMPNEAKGICYTYLTPHFIEVVAGNINNYSPQVFKEAFPFCERIPEEEKHLRDACYGGFGKDFIVMVEGKDIRNIGQMSEDKLRTVRSWRALAGNEKGELACNASALASLYWGGENDPAASFTFCRIAEGTSQTACYKQLADHISYYADDSKRKIELCQEFPSEYRSLCGS